MLQFPASVRLHFMSSHSLLGSPAVSNEPAVSKSNPTEGEGEGTGRAGLCAAESQEEQRSQPRYGVVTVEGDKGARDMRHFYDICVIEI